MIEFNNILRLLQNFQYWARWLTLVLIICFLLGIPGSYHLLLGESHITPFSLNSNDSFIFDVSFTLYEVNSSFNSAVQSCVTGSIALVLNITSLILLKRKISSVARNISSTQRNLFFVALWDFIFQLIWSIHQIWIYTFILSGDLYNPVFDTLYLVIPWFHDFEILTRPNIMFIFCKQIRTVFFAPTESSFAVIKNSAAETTASYVSPTHNSVISRRFVIICNFLNFNHMKYKF